MTGNKSLQFNSRQSFTLQKEFSELTQGRDLQQETDFVLVFLGGVLEEQSEEIPKAHLPTMSCCLCIRTMCDRSLSPGETHKLYTCVIFSTLITFSGDML